MNEKNKSEVETSPSKLDSDSPASSVGPDTKEPKPTRAKSAGAKPAAASIAPYAVVGAGPTDTILYSVAHPPTPTGPRKVLTVHHLQRRLGELGYPEAFADIDGRYGDLTKRAVADWQEAQGAERTGLLTRDQFKAVFEGDPNVTVVLDTHADHS